MAASARGCHTKHRSTGLSCSGPHACKRGDSSRLKALEHHLPKRTCIVRKGLVKICDLGWSIGSSTLRATFCGTPLYVSPELLKRSHYNNKIDIWSVGILTYELLFGKVPFEIQTEQDFVKIVLIQAIR